MKLRMCIVEQPHVWNSVEGLSFESKDNINIGSVFLETFVFEQSVHISILRFVWSKHSDQEGSFPCSTKLNYALRESRMFPLREAPCCHCNSFPGGIGEYIVEQSGGCFGRIIIRGYLYELILQ